ncbi:hypothetical protein AB0H71_13640 [Nocardia sp. NPDC050697]|uniref:hypothetical protein n=1 Tax=Nocardia sp. NPDC050697 TaxID=3155158 RepID=UPI0033F5FC9C
MLLFLLSQAQPMEPVSGTLVQYGAVGIIALVALTAVAVMWKRMSQMNDAERARGDRLEAELLGQNKLISSEFSGVLVRATEAMREVTDMLRHRDRGDR